MGKVNISTPSVKHSGFSWQKNCHELVPRRTFVLSSAALLLPSCRPRPTATDQVRLVLAGNPASIAYLPHTIAQALHFYEAEGLRVTSDAIPGGTRGAQSLVGGSADVVIGFFDQPLRLALQGQEIQAFLNLNRYPGNAVITSASSADTVRSINDLRHKKVGVSDLGSQNHFFLNWVLSRNGMSPNDVTIVATGSHAAALAALQQAKLDAWSGFEPGVSQFRSRFPHARILADARTETGVRELFGVSEYPGAVFYAKSSWLGRNPRAAKGLARAMATSLRWIHERTVDQISEKVPPTYIGPDSTLYRMILGRLLSGFTDRGEMPPLAPESVKNVLSVSLPSVRSSKVPLTKTYTNEYVSGT